MRRLLYYWVLHAYLIPINSKKHVLLKGTELWDRWVVGMDLNKLKRRRALQVNALIAHATILNFTEIHF